MDHQDGSKGRLFSSSLPGMLRSMYLDAVGAPAVEIVPLEFDPAKGVPGLGEVVGKVQAALQALSTHSGVNAGAIAAAAVDLKAAKESAVKAAADAAQALELAKNAEALAKGSARTIGSLSDDALRTMPMLHDVTASREWDGQLDPLAYNILAMSKPETDACEEPVAKMVDRVQRLWAGIAVLDHYKRFGKSDVADRYLRAGGWTSLPQAKEFQALEKRIKAVAMDTAESGSGSQWVPTGVMPTQLPDLRPDFELPGFIQVVPLPRSPIVLPVQGDHFRGFKGAEATASTGQTQIGTRNLSTLNLTFTAVSIKAMTVYSSELEEDAIVVLATVVPADLGTAIRASLSSTWINGQLSAALDTSGAPTGDDDRLCWDGIRKFGDLTGITEDAGAGLTVELATNVKGRMKKYGKKPSEGLWVTGYVGFAKILVLKDSAGTAVYLTADKAGGAGTAMTGAVGTMLGSPIVVEDDYPETMNASGVIDGASTRTGIHYANRRTLHQGELRVTRIESSREQFFQFDQVAYKVTYRGHGQPTRTPSSTYTNVGAVLNIAAA